MPSYSYLAKNSSGEDISGLMEAADERDLAQRLRQDGLFLVRTVSSRSFSGQSLTDRAESILAWLQPVKIKDLIFFSRNLAVMIGAGMSVLRSLEVIVAQSDNPSFKKVIKEVGEDVKKGTSLSDAIGKHENIFGGVFKNMIAAGESAGRLVESLVVLERQMKRDYELMRRIKGALYYPTIVFTAMIGIGVLLMIYVMPTLVDTFKQLDAELPRSTQIMIAISDSFAAYSIALGVGFFSIIVFSIYFLRTPRGKRTLSWLLLHTPIFKTLTMQVNLARIARTLGSLIGAGVHILEGMQISARVLRNGYYSDAVMEARERVEKGDNLSLALTKFPKIFPPLFLQMTSVGEETGKLGSLLTRIAIFYESEVLSATKNMSTIVEPILMVVIGAAVGVFAVSVIQPVYSVVTAL